MIFKFYLRLVYFSVFSLCTDASFAKKGRGVSRGGGGCARANLGYKYDKTVFERILFSGILTFRSR